MKKTYLVVLLIFTLFLTSCKKNELILVTTTSLDNSGFLEYILPFFEDEYGVNVKVIARGTGAALALGAEGQADVLFVHDYDSEIAFMNAGNGEKRANVMYNHFLIVGPVALNLASVKETLDHIYNNKLEFYSRGDSSGTHLKEISQWEMYGYDVSSFGDWYQETGQGMGSTLSMAALDNHFTLVDIATFCAMQDTLDIEIGYEDENELLNQYGIIKVNKNLHNRDDTNADLFYDWILRDDIQELISEYIICDLQMFYPNAE